MKLKYDKAKLRYNFKSNVKLSPKTPTTADLHRHDLVTVGAEFSLYFNLDEKICGIMFSLIDLNVVKDEEPVVAASVPEPEADVSNKKAKRQKKE